MDPIPMTTLQKAISFETKDSAIEPETPKNFMNHDKKSTTKSSIVLMDAAENKKGCCVIFWTKGLTDDVCSMKLYTS